MSKDDKVLNLPLRKVHALEILRGEKVREYRWPSDHWLRRIGEFDPADPLTMIGFKHFDRVHFHPYNKSWWLDVEVKDIDIYTVNQDFIDDVGHEVQVNIGDDIIVISLGKVLGTNIALAAQR